MSKSRMLRVALWCLMLGIVAFSAAVATQADAPTGPQSGGASVADIDSGETTTIQNKELYFDTKSAMYAANEEWLTFACELPDGQMPIGSKHSMEMYYYSMYGLGNLLFRSGMGVHMVHNPLFSKHVREDKGMPWYQKKMGNKIFMQHKLKQFVERTGASKAKGTFPPKGAYPIFLEYAGGDPSFTQAPDLMDFGTLRWDPAKMDKTLSPGAWGQALSKQVLWARDFLTGENVIDGKSYIGNDQFDGGNGFRGAILVAQAITKSFALKSMLAYDAKTGKLGGVDPATYNPANGPIYYPHAYQVKYMPAMKGMPPMPASFTVTDKNSDLFDIASLIWGESEFYFLTDPTIKDDYDRVFGDPMKGPALFPTTPHMLSKGITAVNFKNMMGLHFRKEYGTLVDKWHPETMAGDKISTSYAGMAIVALANQHKRLHDVMKLRNGAKMILTAQANFLLKQQNGDGSISDSFNLVKGSLAIASSGPKSLEAQAFAIRGWLAAYGVNKDSKYLNAAEKCYSFMNSKLWSEKAGVYREYVGARNSAYTGLNFGATLGALREIALLRKGKDRRGVVAKLDSFFDKVARKNGLQISEIGMTGEMMPTAEKKMEMMKMMKKLMKDDPAKAKMMKKKMADSDGDGVPKPPFVMGTEFGAAPVSRSEITIKTQ